MPCPFLASLLMMVIFCLFQLVDFFAAYPDAGSATRGFRQAIEVIRGNIAWLDRYENME